MVKKIKSEIGVEGKNSLGFLFSYKESDVSKKDDQTIIAVSFKSGISKEFPSKFKKLEDFDVEQIFEGQTTELYIRPEDYKEGFLKEKKDFDLDVDFFKKEFKEKKHLYKKDLSFEQYGYLNSFSIAALYTVCERWENEDVKLSVLKDCIGEKFNNGEDLLSLFEDFENANLNNFIKETSVSIATNEDREIVPPPSVRKNRM